MSTKHTPGPWFTRDNNGLTIVSSPDPQPGSLFIADCKISSAYRPIEEAQANASLIAAAPEMLESIDTEMLEAIADEIDCFEHSARAASLRLLAKRQRAAIAKATQPPSK